MRIIIVRIIIAALAAISVTGTGALAQQKASREAGTFANKVAAANTFEIQSSELAKVRAQSADVKSFAEQMIKDHTKVGEDFRSAVREANVSPPPVEEPDAKQQATLARLRVAEGAGFDKVYVSAQLAAHKEAVSLFRKYAASGRTAPLKQFAQNTLPVLEHHLSMVQELSRPSGIAGRQAPKGIGGAAIGPPAEAPQSGMKR
jgi:putative membrane protein